MNKTSVRRDQGVCDHVSQTIDHCRVTWDDLCLLHTVAFIYSLSAMLKGFCYGTRIRGDIHLRRPRLVLIKSLS